MTNECAGSPPANDDNEASNGAELRPAYSWGEPDTPRPSNHRVHGGFKDDRDEREDNDLLPGFLLEPGKIAALDTALTADPTPPVLETQTLVRSGLCPKPPVISVLNGSLTHAAIRYVAGLYSLVAGSSASRASRLSPFSGSSGSAPDWSPRKGKRMVVRVFSDTHSAGHLVRQMEYAMALASFSAVRLTASGADYTHAVLFGFAMPPELPPDFPKSRAIGIATAPLSERPMPLEFLDFAQRRLQSYFVSSRRSAHQHALPAPLKCRALPPPILSEWCGGSGGQHDAPPPKTKLISILINRKATAPGHHYRRALARALLAQNLPVDVFGVGCIDLVSTPPSEPRLKRMRGPVADPSAALDPYLFTICVESTLTGAFYSAKSIRALMRRTNVIYLGSPELRDRYHDAITPLTGQLDDDVRLIREIAREPLRHYMPIDDAYIRQIRQTEALATHFPSLFV